MPDSLKEYLAQLDPAEAYELWLWLDDDVKVAVYQMMDVIKPKAEQSEDFET